MPKNKILLVYPLMGMSGALVRHLPLSLLYAAADSVAAGFEVVLLDVRLYPQTWQDELRRLVSAETLLVGVSVMTGTPIKSALTVSRAIKELDPGLPVVWGGPHALFCSSEILAEPSVDFVIRGYGSLALLQLARFIAGEPDALTPESIPGLASRAEDGQTVVSVPMQPFFEVIDYRKIPYPLVEKNLPMYGQLDNGEQIFSLYSTMGCPYHCAFCSSPAHYAAHATRYLLLPPQDVVDHIAHVHSKYGASYIYFIDDDSFVSLQHVNDIIDEINRRGVKVRLGFRGARVDELMRMDDAYLSKLARAGTNILHIGAESGSQRILDLVDKNIRVADIVAVNRKLAGHPEIIAAYNFVVGIPGETLDDLEGTRKLIMQLIGENHSAIVFAPNKYRPLPGTALYEVAKKHGYLPPSNLEGWSDVEVESEFRLPWFTEPLAEMIAMMQVTSYFIDNKLDKLPMGNSFKYRLAKWLGRLYTPVARFRFRHGITSFFVERFFFRLLVHRVRD